MQCLFETGRSSSSLLAMTYISMDNTYVCSDWSVPMPSAGEEDSEVEEVCFVLIISVGPLVQDESSAYSVMFESSVV